MRDNEFTRILDWPGYRVFRHEIDETAKTLRLWVRRKRGNRKLIWNRFSKLTFNWDRMDIDRSERPTSVVRAKAAMRGHFKTGHMEWPGT